MIVCRPFIFSLHNNIKWGKVLVNKFISHKILYIRNLHRN